MKNPFSLTFGKEPLSLISRNLQNEEIIESFKADNPDFQVCMITGVRGSGKTVAMTTIANDLRKAGGYDGWKVGGNLALAKNIVAAVEYHKLDAKLDSKKDTETLWSEVIFTF